MIRKATIEDIDAISAIYEHIHAEEAAGKSVIGWIKGVYPTRKTAADSVERGDMYVLCDDDKVIAAAIINRNQVDVYKNGSWLYPSSDDEAAVLHTLVVEPSAAGKGAGRRFVAFYEQLAEEWGLSVLRMDTNEKNIRARSLYASLGYREADIVPCTFNGIPNVQLVLLEKKL